MSSSTFTQILFRSLLDSPAIVEITAQVLEKAIPIIREHFTFSADEISRAYQDSCRYSFVAISIGLDAPDSREELRREVEKRENCDFAQIFSETGEDENFGYPASINLISFYP